jgi:hypothetical protein
MQRKTNIFKQIKINKFMKEHNIEQETISNLYDKIDEQDKELLFSLLKKYYIKTESFKALKSIIDNQSIWDDLEND